MKLYNCDIKEIESINPLNISVAVYGLGKMGLPLAAVFASEGFKVVGVDINKDVVDRINRGGNPIVKEESLSELIDNVVSKGNLIATTDGVEASKKTDVKIIIVPTFLDGSNQPDLAMVQSVAEKIGQGLQEGDLVILESTAPPGTTIDLVARILENQSGLKLNKDFAVAHCPERTNSGTAIADIMGRVNPKIIGASDERSAKIVKCIYKEINSRNVIVVKDVETAEMVKLSEMIYRDVKIAYANSLVLICDQLGINASEVIEAANTDADCEILNPGPGVGGHCIPVYPYFIFNKVKKNIDLLKSARKINDSMSGYTIKLAEEVLRENGRSLKDSNVLILGIAYRGGVKETRLSPGIKIYRELESRVNELFVLDPLFNREEIEKCGLNYKDSFNDIDCIIITAEHNEFKELNWEGIAGQLRTKTIVDTKAIINFNELKRIGFSIRSVGYAK